MSGWTQLFVKAPEVSGYTTPESIKRIDDHISGTFPASFKCPPPENIPIQESDGTWEVRVLDNRFTPMVIDVLKKHYGLEVVRQIDHKE
jgi:hypothetical protein